MECGDSDPAGFFMNQSQLDFQAVMQGIIRVVGIAMIGAGMYLGFLSFDKARSILDNPNTLAVWLELDKKFPAPPENLKPVPEKPGVPEADKAFLRMYYEMKSYFILFISYIYLWVLVKISGTFITQGIQVLLKDMNSRKGKSD